MRADGRDPLVHFIETGEAQGRWPNPTGTAYARYPAPPPPRRPLRPGPPDGRPPRVDVAVPVYGQADKALACLDSVLSHPQRTPFELVVVDDRGPESGEGAGLAAELDALDRAGALTLVRNDRNRGFTWSANLALSLHPDRDVVLLNSDVIVFGDWLDRLAAAASRTPLAATVTPFSNNATLFSYPRSPQGGGYGFERADAEIDALARRVNAGRWAEIPTGVGFCMYLVRDALRDVGLFDEAAFGRGYGEDVDLCIRLADRGWRNLLAADVWVRHFGGSSFAGERATLSERAEATLRARHPGWPERVAAWSARDPLRRLRARLDQARLETAGHGR